MRGLLPRVALQLWIVAFIVFFGAEIVHQEPTLRVATHLAFGIPLAAWAVLRLRGPRSVLDLAILGALVLYALTAVLARDPVGGTETLGLAVANVVVFWAARDVARNPPHRELVAITAATALALTLAFNAALLISEKAAWIAAGGGLPPLEGRLVFPWETVNVMPVLVLLAVPFLAWSPAGPIRRLLVLVVAPSAVVVVPISVGRAGWLAMAVAGLVAALLLPAPWRLAGRALRGRSRTTLTIGAVAAALFLIAIVGLATGPLVRGLVESGRGLLWQQALAIVGDQPVVGIGPGAYARARLTYPPAAADLLAVRLTHNVFLQTALELGVVGIVGVAGVGLAWIREAMSRAGALATAERVGIAVLIGVAAAGLLDDFSFLPAVTALTVVIAGWSLGPGVHDDLPIRRGRLLAPAIVGALMLAALPGIVRVDIARGAALDARGAAVDGRWSEAATAFERAALQHPQLAAYWLGLGQSRAYAGDAVGADDAYRLADAANPGDPRAVGALAALASDDADQVALLQDAADQTTGDPQYAYRLGRALAEAGDPDGAAAAWGRAVALRSELFAVLPYDESGIDRAVVADAARAWVAGNPRPAPAEDELVHLNLDLALDTLDGSAPSAWLAADAARDSDLDRARQLAERAVAEVPSEKWGYHALAMVEQLECAGAGSTAASDLDLELLSGGSSPPPPAVAVRREFIYREASLGAYQPPDVPELPDPGRWPWSLIGLEPKCNA